MSSSEGSIVTRSTEISHLSGRAAAMEQTAEQRLQPCLVILKAAPWCVLLYGELPVFQDTGTP